MDKYAATMIDNLKNSGASQAEIDAETVKMASFSEKYQNPLFNAAVTYMEILPVGVLVTLISSFILRRKVAKA
jgi:hypothetical protein